MPPLSIANNRCSNCQRHFDTRELKKCSACKVAKYCSKECQKDHWKHHKDGCRVSRQTRLEIAAYPELVRRSRSLTKWTKLWSYTFMYIARVAFDVKNKPADYLDTHLMFIQVDERVDASCPAQTFRVLSTSIMMDEEFQSWLRRRHFSDDEIGDSLQKSSGGKTLRIFLVWNAIGVIRRWLWALLPDQDREVLGGDGLAALLGIDGGTWANHFKSRVEAGTPFPPADGSYA